jgi:hypothetical protein
VSLWKRAQAIREYVAENMCAVEESGCMVTPGGSFEKWGEWALAYADEIDPISRVRRDAAEMVRKHKAKIAALAATANVTALESEEPNP